MERVENLENKVLSSPLTEIFIKQILERIDFIDVLILKKFYLTGKEFPNDIQPYCFPFLYNELKLQHQINLTLEGLRKRLNALVNLGLLKKVEKTNPSIYFPKEEMKETVRKIIFKFFERYGFESLLKDLMK
ncbi:MAG: hypothetical protein QW409_01920 [Candidatus Aenigmatarchaeota archaeon]